MSLMGGLNQMFFFSFWYHYQGQISQSQFTYCVIILGFKGSLGHDYLDYAGLVKSWLLNMCMLPYCLPPSILAIIGAQYKIFVHVFTSHFGCSWQRCLYPHPTYALPCYLPTRGWNNIPSRHNFFPIINKCLNHWLQGPWNTQQVINCLYYLIEEQD